MASLDKGDKMRKSIFTVGMMLNLVVLQGCVHLETESEPIYLNAAYSTDERIDDLMARMTLSEKVAQMCQYVGFNYLKQVPAEMSAEDILKSDSQASYKGLKTKDLAQMVVDGEIGSFLHVLTAEHANQLQGLASKSRLKIPLLLGIDAIHGNGMVHGCTIYPSPISLASSFSDEYAYRLGKETAKEMRATGSHWAFTPNVDVLRDPRWGRVGETFGEDPYLVGRLGAAMIRGLQGDQAIERDHVLACAKHFIAGSEPANGLNLAPMDVSERTLREIYLKPYLVAIEAEVFTIMAAHNEVNGVPCHMDKRLLTDVLREDYDFAGFYVSDWLDIHRIETLHQVARDFKEACYLAVDAGMDMNMHGPDFLEAVVSLVEEGMLEQERIDYACEKILRAKFELGLFENALVDLDRVAESIFTPAHQQSALEMARRSMVLLKNDGILPLTSTAPKKILVTGPNANNHSVLGDWTKPQPEDQVVTVYEGIRELGTQRGHQVDFYDSNENIRTLNQNDIARTAAVATNYNYVVVVVGDNSLRHLGMKVKTAGENMARADIDLAGEQLELVKALHATGVPTLVVYVNGKPIAEPWIQDHIPAILESWESGSFAGQVVAEVLFGEVNPSGKLPLTFPRSVGQLQMVYNHKPSSYYRDYAFEKTVPLYPFGHGLSYSSYAYSDLVVDVDEKNQTISLSVTVKNESDQRGEEVVQIYFRDAYSSVTRPVKELASYRRIELDGKESQIVSFEIPIEQLSFYDIQMQRCVEPGTFIWMAGGSSADKALISTSVEIEGRVEYYR